MAHVTIARMDPSEAMRVRAIRLRALEEAPEAFGSTLARDAARPMQEWTTRLENAAAATFVATRDDTDVGLVTTIPWPDREGAVGLFSMWVAPEARQQGVGLLLIDAVTSWARAGGYDRVYLDVADANPPAIALYKRCGFVRTGNSGTLPAPREYSTEHERVLVLAS